jgi:ribosomal protein L35
MFVKPDDKGGVLEYHHYEVPTLIYIWLLILCTFDSLCLQFVQVRNITSKEKMAKWKKKWRPRTPITSKVKKVKIKFYSSFKDRFKPLNDGTIRRWKEGKRHNAHLKSKKSKRRLRQPGLVPPAYAKVMKKLNFCNWEIEHETVWLRWKPVSSSFYQIILLTGTQKIFMFQFNFIGINWVFEIWWNWR